MYDKTEIKLLNQLKKVKIIYYDHSSIFYWLYKKKIFRDTIYYEYKNCDYVISLVPLENDYLFKKWGINSILMDNPITFEYDLVKPSDLKYKKIIMIGRAEDTRKRFKLGIYAMEFIVKAIKECEMNIISYQEQKLKKLIKRLSLEKNVRFVGYHKNIELYLKNYSLHILPSLTEAYPMVLSETKIFGIPSIICGLDYIALANKGTVIIYDDNPETIAKETIKILNDYNYRKRLGREARQSMMKHKNSLIRKKWLKLISLLYRGKKLQNFKKYDIRIKMNEKETKTILQNQLILLKKRYKENKLILILHIF